MSIGWVVVETADEVVVLMLIMDVELLEVVDGAPTVVDTLLLLVVLVIAGGVMTVVVVVVATELEELDVLDRVARGVLSQTTSRE